MKTVYLVRHGESEINIGDASTVLDEESGLSERGKEQAKAVAARCRKLSVDAIIASTQARARQTAHAIEEATGLPITYSDLFIERQLPSAVRGKTRGESQQALMDWSDDFFTGKEQFRSIVDRAGEALAFLHEHPSPSLLVITHGFFLRTMLARLMFGEDLQVSDLRKFMRATRTDNTGITVLTYGTVPMHAVDPHEERWTIRVYNDHAHLG